MITIVIIVIIIITIIIIKENLKALHDIAEKEHKDKKKQSMDSYLHRKKYENAVIHYNCLRIL